MESQIVNYNEETFSSSSLWFQCCSSRRTDSFPLGPLCSKIDATTNGGGSVSNFVEDAGHYYNRNKWGLRSWWYESRPPLLAILKHYYIEVITSFMISSNLTLLDNLHNTLHVSIIFTIKNRRVKIALFFTSTSITNQSFSLFNCIHVRDS